MSERLVHREDFEQLLAVRPLTRSAHFAIHHVKRGPMQQHRTAPRLGTPNLSTPDALPRAESVDNLPGPALPAHWLGVMAPKRHARRAVTRNLVKRLARQAFAGHERALPGGLWLVRLRQPISRTQFVSARSEALELALRSELDALIAPLAAPLPGIERGAAPRAANA